MTPRPDPNLHWLVKELLLDDDTKDLVHEGALLDTGVLFQREVDVKDTVTTGKPTNKMANPFTM